VAFAGGYRALGQSTNNADLLKRRALAQWVAANQLAMMQLNAAAAASATGEARQAGIDFAWQATLTETPNPAFRKVDIAVADKSEPGYRLARLSAYLSLSQ
jgi:general secretion pathway protein I